MHVILFDKADWRRQLYPLTWTRPVSDLRVGIVTIAEKWSLSLGATFSFLSEDYLQGKYPLETKQRFRPGIGLSHEGEVLGLSGDNVSKSSNADPTILLKGNTLPNPTLSQEIVDLKAGEYIADSDGRWIAVCLLADHLSTLAKLDEATLVQLLDEQYSVLPCAVTVQLIEYPEQLFLENGAQIEYDYNFLVKGRQSAPISTSNQLLGTRIFAEEGVKVECSILNATSGPIYLGKNSEVWEACAIRGPFALCESAQVKMGAKIYSDVTVGPYSRVGGELNTCVIWGHSSKGHDGYMGCAVVGEWCNWGADTNNSNLKNNYKDVKIFDYSLGHFRDSGLQFYGLIMGDHSKCAINTAFNTGTVVGVGASVFGAGFPPTFIPDFAWGGSEGFSEHKLDRMQETASLVFARRNRIFDEVEKKLLDDVFELSKSFRSF